MQAPHPYDELCRSFEKLLHRPLTDKEKKLLTSEGTSLDAQALLHRWEERAVDPKD